MEQVQKVRDLEKSIKADIKTVNNVIEIRKVTYLLVSNSCDYM